MKITFDLTAEEMKKQMLDQFVRQTKDKGVDIKYSDIKLESRSKEEGVYVPVESLRFSLDVPNA